MAALSNGQRRSPSRHEFSVSEANARVMPSVPANMKAIQSNPGARRSILEESLSMSLRDRLKIIITTREKTSMELSTCFVRNSVRKSFAAI
jgi:hypothetical protein